MKGRIIPAIAAAAALTLALPAARAAELGDKAAPLKIAEWVKGKSVNLADGKGKNIYVVEFWATWCPPCRTSIPHLTEMQKQFKDKGVIFIGVTTEDPKKVKPFVEKMGEKMDYIVAVDDEEGTSKGYMEAYEINGIPHAFIVDKESRVVWSGHPMAGLDKAIQQVLDGKLDVEKEKKRAAAGPKLEQFMELVMEDGDQAKIEKLAKELEALDKEVGPLMGDKPFKAADMMKLGKFQKAFIAYQQGVQEGASQEKLDQLFKDVAANAPSDVKPEELKADLGFQAAAVAFQQALEEGDQKALEAAEKRLDAAPGKNAMLLNEVAWTILDDGRVKKRNLPLALKLAKAAVESSQSKDPAILDTYARALFDTGKTEDAIALQKKAIELCEDADTKAELQDTLKKYEAKAKK